MGGWDFKECGSIAELKDREKDIQFLFKKSK